MEQPELPEQLTGQGIGSTQLLSTIPYAAAVIAMLARSTASDRTVRRRAYDLSRPHRRGGRAPVGPGLPDAA